jgi:hypothetical protein
LLKFSIALALAQVYRRRVAQAEVTGMMTARRYRNEARAAQALADAESDPKIKAEHSMRAAQWTELALTADVHSDLKRAIRVRKKSTAIKP